VVSHAHGVLARRRQFDAAGCSVAESNIGAPSHAKDVAGHANARARAAPAQPDRDERARLMPSITGPSATVERALPRLFQAIGAARLLQYGEFQIRDLTAARVAKFLDEFDALGHRSGPHVEISHGMDGIGAGRGPNRGDKCDSGGDHERCDRDRMARVREHLKWG
jgi:hypothetical protein